MWHPLILFHAAVVAALSSVWERGELNVSRILLNKKVEADVMSEIACASLAMMEGSQASYCYDTPKCIIAQGAYQASQVGGMGNWKCKFLPRCCDYPYTPSGEDCVTTVNVIHNNENISNAKADCNAMGAVLFSPDKPEHIPAMDAYLKTLGFNGIFHWTDAKLVGGEWRWIGGTGRLVQASEWATPPTNPNTKQCAYLRVGTGLGEDLCTEIQWPLCVTPAPLCH